MGNLDRNPPKPPPNGERSALGGMGASGSSGVGACRYWGTMVAKGVKGVNLPMLT